MSPELQEVYQLYMNLINHIPFVEEDLDYNVLNKHIPHLEKLDQLGNSAISVFDLSRKTHVYVSPLYRERLGLPDDHHEGPEGFEQLMHPEDHLIAVEAGYYFLKMGIEKDSEQLSKYKLVNDYRVKNPGNKWIRMTEQHQILETDPHGNIWLALSIIDVSPNQNLDEPMQSKLVNQQTGEVFAFAGQNEDPVPFRELSVREKEILHLISEGNISKQIANKLHLSVHTVNTHRQNIIKKMNVTNTAEAIRIGTRRGLFYCEGFPSPPSDV